MPMYKKSLLILLVLALTVLGGTVYGLKSQGSEETLDSGTVQEQPAAELVVYVTGAVNKPGIVTLAQGARIADAIDACGGLLPTADESKVNMAKEVQDGQQIRVPEKKGQGQDQQGKSRQKGTSKTQSADAGSPVNINTADAQELDKLPGVGPAMAQRIIDYREQNGGFQNIEDLKKIKGIGEAKFNKLKDQVCL